jgi:hypothetical protein
MSKLKRQEERELPAAEGTSVVSRAEEEVLQI